MKLNTDQVNYTSTWTLYTGLREPTPSEIVAAENQEVSFMKENETDKFLGAFDGSTIAERIKTGRVRTKPLR